LDGRPISLEKPTPKSVGHYDDNDIIGTSLQSVFEVSIKEISPIPHGSRRLPSRRRGQTAVLTDSPHRHLENASISKRKLDRKGSCGAATKKRLGNVPNIKENWSGNARFTGDTSGEYDDE
jgi:hypothetical protein